MCFLSRRPSIRKRLSHLRVQCRNDRTRRSCFWSVPWSWSGVHSQQPSSRRNVSVQSESFERWRGMWFGFFSLEVVKCLSCVILDSDCIRADDQKGETEDRQKKKWEMLNRTFEEELWFCIWYSFKIRFHVLTWIDWPKSAGPKHAAVISAYKISLLPLHAFLVFKS